MHSGAFELTKLAYTKFKDNLIRHRGDQDILQAGVGPTLNNPSYNVWKTNKSDSRHFRGTTN